MAYPLPERPDIHYDEASRTWTYQVVALPVPIVFNPHRDHDPNGLMYALAGDRETLEHHATMLRNVLHEQACGHHGDTKAGCGCDEPHHHNHPVEVERDFQPHPKVQPLVLRARVGDKVVIEFTNLIRCRRVGMHLIGPGTDIHSDGTAVGGFDPLAGYQQTRQYIWQCDHEGAFLFHDLGDPDGDEDGTNAHGLFGALIVEPEGAWWTDPTRDFDDPEARVADGLYVDVHRRPLEELQSTERAPFAGQPGATRPPRHAPEKSSFREYVLFIHDEPEAFELRRNDEPDWSHCDSGNMNGPCFDGLDCHCGPGEHDDAGSHGPHQPGDCNKDWMTAKPHGGSFMCFNYRTEPMKNREVLIWKWLKEGKLKKTVINEEQHHSSWMFGDPATPILKAYLGDPVRIHLIHAGVKETHVFHLHVYEWYADPGNPCSPLIDAITITPGSGHTIVPLYGAGNLQGVPGDVIWHCHLYPHFHMGMWGMFRTFETLQTGQTGPKVNSTDPLYRDRAIGLYPDGTPIERLAVLPDRAPPPAPTPDRPGFPLYIAGEMQQKSPVPPWPEQAGAMPVAFDYRPATHLEAAAMNANPRPGELFTYFPHPENRALWFDASRDCANPELIERSQPSRVEHDIAVARGLIDYNSHGWHDPDGHFYYLADGRQQGDAHPKPTEPLFLRAHHGDVLNLTFENAIGFRKPLGPTCDPDGTPIPQPALGQLERMNFDYNIPPCDAIQVNGKTAAECGLHVHLVKFDPIVADGASTGWNYMSAPSDGKKMVYRWWCDEEFGTVFFHDHLYANTRQRHGLYGGLIVEPEGARILDPDNPETEILTGQKALVELPDGSHFQEICVGIGDWIAMYDRDGNPLEAPEHPSSHEDNGTMCVNYRCAPLKERGPHPERWFQPDRDTLTFDVQLGLPVYLRLIQGSHEEQHGFEIHGGVQWRRFRHDAASPMRSQQTLGISEAFTFIIEPPAQPADYLWRFSGAEDTWLGCWGLLRYHVAPPTRQCRRYRVSAVARDIVYRDGDAQRTRLTDPKGLAYLVTDMAEPGGDFQPVASPTPLEPMILRCRQGEWVEVELTNRLPQSGRLAALLQRFRSLCQNESVEYKTGAIWQAWLGVACRAIQRLLRVETWTRSPLIAERHWPELPVEGDRNDPPISTHVSLVADGLPTWIREPGGAERRAEPVETLAAGESKTFLFQTNVEPGPYLLQDMADIRNHRHHGLFGALVVEPVDALPYRVMPGESTAGTDSAPAWTGSRATLVDSKGQRVEEIVLLLHDGVRYYVDGQENAGDLPNPPDIPGDEGIGSKPDTEDQGQKAFNYRSERLDLAFEPMKPCDPSDGKTIHDRTGWFTQSPATPVFQVPPDSDVILRFVCAADKPRNHSLVLHGHAWREWPHRGPNSPVVSSESGLTSGTVRSYAFRSNATPGEYLYRSGVLKWAVAQGLWGILRVR